MKLSIMQPYLFPYIGYFQMISCSDYFVIDDEDQYIKKGWINRNKILVDGSEHLITLPVVKDHYRLNINQRFFVGDPDNKNEEKMLKTIEHAYRKAPHFKDCYQLIQEILCYENKNVADFTSNSLKKICEYLEIVTPMCYQSEINFKKDLNYQESVIYICKQMKATCYINPIGGTELYSTKVFNENDLTLRFIKTRASLEYKQYWNDFVPNLSIIDVMMFNSPEEIKELLEEFDLIEGEM